MTFEEILDQAITMLQRRGRLTYGTLKRQFQLDDAALARARSGDRMSLHPPTFDADQHLGRRADNRTIADAEEVHIG